MCYERYNWGPDDVENCPVMHAAYIPVIWAAIAEIQKAREQRRP